MTRAHGAAELARLRTITALADAVFDGEVPKANGNGTPVEVPQRYVLVHSSRVVARADRLTGGAPQRGRRTLWVHSVGMSKGQADAVAEKVIARYNGWRPEVPGYTCEPMTHEASQPVQKDDTVRPPLYFGVDQFDYYTTPNPPEDLTA